MVLIIIIVLRIKRGVMGLTLTGGIIVSIYINLNYNYYYLKVIEIIILLYYSVSEDTVNGWTSACIIRTSLPPTLLPSLSIYLQRY